MKIFVIGPQFCDSFARNISTTFERMGHEVFTHAGTRHRHDVAGLRNALWTNAGRLVPAIEARFFNELYAAVESCHPSLVLVTHSLFTAAQVERIKKAAQSPVFCWYIDAMTNVRGDALFGNAYDHVFAKEPRFVETLARKLKVNATYLPEACNPVWHKPVDPTPEQFAKYGCDIGAQGTLHPYRAKFFEAFEGSGLKVKIWGSVAQRSVRSSSRDYFQFRYIGEGEKALAFRSTKIIVNNIHFTEAVGVNNTLFEAAGCGALVLCDAKETLPSLFEIGEEVVTFESREELLKKAHYYLSPAGEAERLAIRERAWKRAHRDHTYERRLQTILSTL